jgi:hypothetical protein
MRNGYEPVTVKTTAGPVTLARPKVRGTTEAFASRLLGAGVSKSNALESLCIAGFVRGPSMRDVEAMLAEALGAQAALSKSTVSRICQAIAEEFEAGRTRMLDLLRPSQPPRNMSIESLHVCRRSWPISGHFGTGRCPCDGARRSARRRVAGLGHALGIGRTHVHRNRLDAGATLGSKLGEQAIQRGGVPAFGAPHDLPPAVVGHQRQVRVATFPGHLVHTDVHQPIQALGVEPVSGDPLSDTTHRLLVDAGQAAHRGLVHLRDQPHHQVLEVGRLPTDQHLPHGAHLRFGAQQGVDASAVAGQPPMSPHQNPGSISRPFTGGAAYWVVIAQSGHSRSCSESDST